MLVGGPYSLMGRELFVETYFGIPSVDILVFSQGQQQCGLMLAVL